MRNLRPFRLFIGLIAALTSLVAGGTAFATNRGSLSNSSTVSPMAELGLDAKSLERLSIKLNQQRDVRALLAALGPGSTGGGDSCHQQIVKNYVRLVTGFRLGLLFGTKELSNSLLFETLASAEIQMGRDLKKDGEPVEALNVPDLKLITVDRKICKSLKDANFDSRVMGLLMHETYGLARVPDQEDKQKMKPSARMLVQIEEFSQGLDIGEEAWVVVEKFTSELRRRGSPLWKLKQKDHDSGNSREQVDFKSFRLLEVSHHHEGRFDDYRGHDCDPHPDEACGVNWWRDVKTFMVILTREDGGSAWRESKSIFVYFQVSSDHRELMLGEPEKSRITVLEDHPPAATFLKINEM